MISGSDDRTARQWDLKSGKEIKDARGVCKGRVYTVAVSMNGRWVVIEFSLVAKVIVGS
jgi:hypothetical protein